MQAYHGSEGSLDGHGGDDRVEAQRLRVSHAAAGGRHRVHPGLGRRDKGHEGPVVRVAVEGAGRVRRPQLPGTPPEDLLGEVSALLGRQVAAEPPREADHKGGLVLGAHELGEAVAHGSDQRGLHHEAAKAVLGTHHPIQRLQERVGSQGRGATRTH